MAKVLNNFTAGKMDSDTHYSLLENKDYVRSENLRIIGEGDDGSLKNLKGSLEVSNYSENKQMTVVGHYEGLNNKSYYFLAQSNGKSKIIEYDVETKISRVIIQDTTVLRFDLIRWDKGQVIFPYKYLLSVNQVGDLLIFSHEVWRNVRCINLTRVQDYVLGFTEEDIMLAKKPPFQEPKILSLYNDTKLNDESRKNKFVSFAYRFKYKDGDYSSLSFFSKVAFQTKDVNQFAINAERENLAMVNKTNAVKLLVYSGGKDVTDIEVYAREHNSVATYLIYSFNKADNNNYGNNILLPEIIYTYSNNYKVLPNDEAKLIYNNVPTYPKAQDVAGNRVFFGNYKEGYDLGLASKINMELRLDNTTPVLNNNETVVSLYAYKIGIVYFDDYNVSTTVLVNQNQEQNEILVPFDKRFSVNAIKAKLNHPPPTWATKFKFVVNSQDLTYETLYITLIRKIGVKVYLYLSGDNVQRVKKGDVLYRVDALETILKEYKVIDVKQMDVPDGVSIKGLYAEIEVDSTFLIETYNNQNVYKSHNKYWAVIDAEPNSTNPRRYDATSGYTGTYDGNFYSSYENRGTLYKSDYSAIREGDIIKLSVDLTYGRDKKGRGEDAIEISGTVTISKEMYATRQYDNIYLFLLDNFDSPYVKIEENGNEIKILTNDKYPDLVRATGGWIYDWAVNYGNRDERAVVKVRTETVLTRGNKPIIFRTREEENLSDFYFETPNTFLIQNGQHIGAEPDGYFNTGFHNGYVWGNGVESYKIKDLFNAKKLKYDFRPNAVEIKGYKQVHRKTDITYSGIYNYDLGINNLSEFNNALVNWISLPINYGEIQRLISLDGNITSCLTNKFIDVFYEKSIIADMQGIETVALSDKVLGGYKVLPYEYGISYNPESVVKSGNAIMAVDKNRSRFLLKQGFEITELNAPRSGFHKEGVEVLEQYDSFQGVYDDAHGEYVVSLNNEKSIAFSLLTQGFVNYYTYKSDFLFSMNGKPFASYKGIVYQNEVTESYSNFAGQGTMNVKVVYVVNPEIDSDKVFKAMFLQSNTPWNTKIRTNYTESQISENLYQKKESFYYTDCFRNVLGYNTSVGLGVIQEINANILKFSRSFDNDISVGDFLMVQNSNIEYEILNIDKDSLTLSNVIGLSIDQYAFAIKKYVGGYRPDGDPIRGKWMEITLEKMTSESIYITSASTEIIKSFL
jgi:hypothetical protein